MTTAVETQAADGADHPRPSLRDRKKDATRQLLEDTAWDLFCEQGYDETTVHQIADRANVAPRTFFRYFPSKEAVLYPELDAKLSYLADAFAARPADEPALVSLVAALDQVAVDIANDRTRVFERFEMLKQAGMGCSSVFVNNRVIESVADLVRRRLEGQPEADLQARLAAEVLNVVMATSNEQWLDKGGVTDFATEARHCFDLIRGLAGASLP